MTEWDPNEFKEDVLSLETTVNEFWNALDFSDTTGNMLEAYTIIEQMLCVHEKDGMVIVENRK